MKHLVSNIHSTTFLFHFKQYVNVKFYFLFLITNSPLFSFIKQKNPVKFLSNNVWKEGIYSPSVQK